MKYAVWFSLLFTLFALCGSQTGFCRGGGPLRRVDPFIGTAGDHGQVDPAACVPYGMVRVGPDTDPRTHSGYDYDQTRLSGISVNRLSGVGCKGNGGNLSLLPSDGRKDLNIVKSSERACPGYYAAALDNGVKIELTATRNVAVERFTYPAGSDGVVMLRTASSFVKIREARYEILPEGRIVGRIAAGTTCNRGVYTFWFDLRANRPFRAEGVGKNRVRLDFGRSNGTPVEIRIALSPIDAETAAAENELAAARDFDRIRRDAAARWEKLLSTVKVRGGTPEDRTLFYTSLYRVFLSPGNVTSYNWTYRATDGTIRPADDFTCYGSWSIWDSYRTKFPLITLLDPETMRDICLSLSHLYRTGKEPWATPHESMPTVRTEHASVVLLDAYNKGIRDIGLAEAWPAIRRELDGLPKDRPDLCLETAIDGWAAARIAGILGYREEEERLDRESRALFTTTWRKEFMTPDSTYSRMKQSGLYQGTRWQYRWAVPQYLEQMARLTGGTGVLEAQLDRFFAQNLNNQGNEPGLHAPYLFNLLGAPQKSQRLVTKLLTERTTHRYGGNAEYPEPVVRRIFQASPDGFLPEMDEDDGTMGAWYAFSAMGLFPLIPGEPWYELVSPLFDRVEIRLPGERRFVIRTKGRRKITDPIREVSLNGRILTDYRLPHDTIVRGGELLLTY